MPGAPGSLKYRLLAREELAARVAPCTCRREHRVRFEVILIVAIIAVSRQPILVDDEHTSPALMVGLSAVILALTFDYLLRPKC